MSRPDAAIVRGEVVHMRVHPTRHRLNYKVFAWLVDVDRLEALSREHRWFSLDRLNLFSLRAKDHGYRDQRSIAEFAWDQVREAGLEEAVSHIEMLAYPRLLGHAFNPLTVYFCRGHDDALHLVIYEVRNTFGEALTYVVPAGEPQNGAYVHEADKRFYVSPFNAVEGRYLFHVRTEDDALTVGVALKLAKRPLLRTHFTGRMKPLTRGAMLMLPLAYPAMTLKVVAAIHWEAAKLWLKGLRLRDRPEAPAQAIFHEGGRAT